MTRSLGVDELRSRADQVATRLHAELRAGKRDKIDYDTIRVACLGEAIPNHQFADFVERTLRRVVEFTAAYPDHGAKHDDLKALCSRKGWKTGRDGRFAAGIVPANKGKRMPYNANSAATQFKKGHRGGRAALQYKPIGTERLSKEGYVERKINDGMPFQRRWRGVHLLNWEALYGPVPKGHCLKSLDGTKANTDPSNWKLVPRALLPRLNGKSGRNYDHAPAELKPTIMAIAKLEQGIRDTQTQREKAAA